MFAKIGVPAKYRNVRSMRNNFPRGESEDTLWGIGRKRRAVRAAEPCGDMSFVHTFMLAYDGNLSLL